MSDSRATATRVGHAIIDPNNRVGKLSEFQPGFNAQVQYGAGGPYQIWPAARLRRATPKEVRKAGLEDVGFLE